MPSPLEIVMGLGYLEPGIDGDDDEEEEEEDVPPDPFPVASVHDVVSCVDFYIRGLHFSRFWPWLGVAPEPEAQHSDPTYGTWLRDRDADHPRWHEGSFDLVERHHDGDFVVVRVARSGAPPGRRGHGGYIQMRVAGMDTRIDWNVTTLDARAIGLVVQAYIRRIDFWAPPK